MSWWRKRTVCGIAGSLAALVSGFSLLPFFEPSFDALLQAALASLLLAGFIVGFLVLPPFVGGRSKPVWAGIGGLICAVVGVPIFVLTWGLVRTISHGLIPLDEAFVSQFGEFTGNAVFLILHAAFFGAGIVITPIMAVASSLLLHCWVFERSR
jgi:hypothetical protein